MDRIKANSYIVINKTRIALLLLGLPLMLIAQTENWVYHYNGFGDSSDVAYCVIYGDDGNIYAAGGGYDSITHYNFTIISLDRDGNERWVYKYPDYSSSCAVSLVYGADGNLYGLGKGNEYYYSELDFIIVSLTTNGGERWVYTYDGSQAADEPNGIVYGPDGNIYACGVSRRAGGNGDFTVLSVTSTGEERWVYKFDTSGSHFEVAKAIGFGEDGNVYAAGSISQPSSSATDFGVVSLDTAGNERWLYRYNGSGNWYDVADCISCRNNRVFVGGHTSDAQSTDNLVIVCLDSAGTDHWVYEYDEDSTSSLPGAIDVADDGNIYAAGHCHQMHSDICCVSVDENGGFRWLYYYNGAFDWYDGARALDCGRDGLIYLGGRSVDTNYNPIFTVIALNDAGEQQWIYKYDSTGQYGDAYSITTDTTGYIYAAGLHWTTAGHYDFIVLSLSNGLGAGEYSEHVNSNDVIRIYPNPTRTSYVIHVAPGVRSIQLYDVLGKLVQEEILSAYTKEKKLILKNLSAGVYFLKSKMDDRTDTQKLILLK